MFGRRKSLIVGGPDYESKLLFELRNRVEALERHETRNSCPHCPSWHDTLLTVRLDGDTGVLRNVSIRTCRVCGQQLDVDWGIPVSEEA